MIRETLFAAALAVASAGALATATPEEAAQLGTSLTPLGAEVAGSKDGTIPDWKGGIDPPPGFRPGDKKRPDPYAGEKPTFSITGQNADQYKDRLTAVTYALLKRYPTMRVDVYPTHRPVTFPQAVLDNTVKNATRARLAANGLAVENSLPGVPFPIAKNGNEAMWNHLLRYQGVASVCKYDSYNIDSAGVATLATTGFSYREWPLFRPENTNKVVEGSDIYALTKQEYIAPARRASEALVVYDYVDPIANPRKAWQYLPGQRRVKLAPEIAYDTPNPGVAGSLTYDDAFIFNGALDRYDWKLVGKREMIVPYDDYKALYYPGDAKAVTTPDHYSPDLSRWELHRVYVVEATLKPDKRHIYHKRTFYLDEDSWMAVASDEYDARGQLFRGVFAYTAFAYDSKSIGASLQIGYDLIGGTWASQGNCGLYYGIEQRGPFPKSDWQPDALAGAGIR